MKIIHRALCAGLAAVFALPLATTAVAAQNTVTPFQLLSQATGLTVPQLQMVLHAQTTHAALYRTSYERVDARFQQAVGPAMYQHLKQHLELTPQHVQYLTALAEVRSSERVEGR